MTDESVVRVGPAGEGVLEVRCRIGSGGMGEVREAFDPMLMRRMAVKVLHSERSSDAIARRRFLEEAQITSQLDHPNIVPVHALGRAGDGGLYYTMKLVEGDTLSERLAASPVAVRSTKDLFELVQVFLKVCDAVAFAHDRGVIHRDLKPDNIMVGRHGQVYLMDWGLARLKSRTPAGDGAGGEGGESDAARTRDGSIVGTLVYMAPEQAAGRIDEIDERSDVFSLGAILYEILISEPPYPRGAISEILPMVAKAEIVNPQKRSPVHLPPRLCAIAMKALSRSPDDRQQSAGELKRDVERFLQSGWQFPTRTFAPGALIVREGTLGETAYVILGGTCRAFLTSGGEQRDLRTMGRGEVFGETAVFSSSPRSASVEAVDTVTVIEITREQFAEDLGMGFWLGLFAHALADRFQEKEERVLELERELAALRDEGSP